MNLLNKMKVFWDHLLNSFMWIAGITFIAAMLLVCVDVMMRYWFNRPLIFVTEICEYSLLVINFLSASWILREEGHVKMELVLDRLNPKTQVIITTVISFLGALTLLIIAWYAGETAWDNFKRGLPIAKTLQLPKAPFLALISICSLLICIQFICRSYIHLEKWRSLQKRRR